MVGVKNILQCPYCMKLTFFYFALCFFGPQKMTTNYTYRTTWNQIWRFILGYIAFYNHFICYRIIRYIPTIYFLAILFPASHSFFYFFLLLGIDGIVYIPSFDKLLRHCTIGNTLQILTPQLRGSIWTGRRKVKKLNYVSRRKQLLVRYDRKR